MQRDELKAAVVIAFNTGHSVVKRRNTIINIDKVNDVVNVEFSVPSLDNSNHFYYKIAGHFKYNVTIGISGIRDAIEMQYEMNKQKMFDNAQDVMQRLKNQADIYMLNAKEVERLMKGK